MKMSNKNKKAILNSQKAQGKDVNNNLKKGQSEMSKKDNRISKEDKKIINNAKNELKADGNYATGIQQHVIIMMGMMQDTGWPYSKHDEIRKTDLIEENRLAVAYSNLKLTLKQYKYNHAYIEPMKFFTNILKADVILMRMRLDFGNSTINLPKPDYRKSTMLTNAKNFDNLMIPYL